MMSTGENMKTIYFTVFPNLVKLASVKICFSRSYKKYEEDCF